MRTDEWIGWCCLVVSVGGWPANRAVGVNKPGNNARGRDLPFWNNKKRMRLMERVWSNSCYQKEKELRQFILYFSCVHTKQIAVFHGHHRKPEWAQMQTLKRSDQKGQRSEKMVNNKWRCCLRVRWWQKRAANDSGVVVNVKCEKFHHVGIDRSKWSRGARRP